MDTRVNATEAARRFSDLLNRVRYQGASYVIVRNGEEVGRLGPAGPVDERRPGTLRELVAALRSLGPVDTELARDLEAARQAQGALPGDPWAS